MTRLYGVIGDPISHSLSPLIHKGWMRDFSLDADYRGYHVPAGQAVAALTALEREGVKGLNVTLPHKSTVLPACSQMDKLVAMLGAANTLTRNPDGSWRADNTDRDGFLQDFQEFVGGGFEGSKMLILGAGGAARAVVHALHHSGAQVVIANRTLQRAEDMCQQFALPAKRAIGLEQLPDALEFADGVINCVSIGQGEGLLDLGQGRGRPFYDLSYGAGTDAVLARANEQGWITRDGIGMLVGQAALSFQIWHGILPNKAVAIGRCRQALEALR
ncbi:MAG: shikimate dehydrogenase [Pseudomonadota bacterium]